MTTNATTLATARRYQADDWLGVNRLPGALHVRHWFLDEDAIPSLHCMKARRLPVGLGSTSGLWSIDGDPDRLAKVDVWECASRNHAHRMLLRVLANVESPAMARDIDLGIGDVAFTVPGTGLVIFARANLAVVVAAIMSETARVAAPAAAIDAALIRADTATADLEQEPQLARVQVRRVSGDEPVRRVDMRVRRNIQTGAFPMVRVYAPLGDLYEQEDGLRFAPADPSEGGAVSVHVQDQVPGQPTRRFVARDTM